MTKRLAALFFPVAAAAVLASPAGAEPSRIAASSRLGYCGGETCLLVSGRRPVTAAPIRIAGHDVAVSGGRRWRAAIPLRLVRAWSAPAARSIMVEVADQDGDAIDAPLPIGVLGQVTRLAFLDVSVRR